MPAPALLEQGYDGVIEDTKDPRGAQSPFESCYLLEVTMEGYARDLCSWMYQH